MLTAGTQAGTSGANFLAIIKLANIPKLSRKQNAHGTDDDHNGENMTDGDSSSESEVDEDTKLHYRRAKHLGGINRVRCMPQRPGIVASWSDRALVEVIGHRCTSYAAISCHIQ